jgi:hypothetical protein
MWDSDSKYFYSVEPKTHEKALVKEVIGVYPFYFSMVPWNSPCADAWLSVLNKDELWTEWPVASASKKCPAYSQDTKFHGKEVGGCMWNGRRGHMPTASCFRPWRDESGLRQSTADSDHFQRS